jgi:ABC-type multidrug transport system fused ATPase/permease subunit
MDRVRYAVESARLDDFIGQLSEGYQTQVGERGSQISTGQVQRLAIARAFYRDTPILVMDEPTSSVDPETENALIESISALKLKKTMLTIAHRLTTISVSDRIILLDQGEIKEMGTHSDLMAHRQGYYGLFTGSGYELD